MGDITKYINVKSIYKPPARTDTFYAKIVSVGEKLSIDKNDLNLIGSGGNEFMLIEEISIDEGSIVYSSFQYFEFFSYEYPKSWKPPKDVSITFIEVEDGKIFQTLNKIVTDSNLRKFTGIAPGNLHKYSIELEINRFTPEGEKVFGGNFTLYPKSLPKWVNTYGSSGNQTFSIDFQIVGYQLDEKISPPK